MTLSDTLIILATLLSPLIAVQVSEFVRNRGEIRGRKLQIFKSLMATRAYSLSPLHVEALNSIDLNFSPKNKREKIVLNCWQQYLDHLNTKSDSQEAWQIRRVDLFVDLLHSMATVLNYDFNKTQIKNAVYAPQAHGRIELEQEQVRQFTLELLEGKRVLPMFVVNLPNQSTTEQK